MSKAFADDERENPAFSVHETSDGAYQIVIEPNWISPMLRVGSPFEAADAAKAWIDNESASWFTKFRRGRL